MAMRVTGFDAVSIAILISFCGFLALLVTQNTWWKSKAFLYLAVAFLTVCLLSLASMANFSFKAVLVLLLVLVFPFYVLIYKHLMGESIGPLVHPYKLIEKYKDRKKSIALLSILYLPHVAFVCMIVALVIFEFII